MVGLSGMNSKADGWVGSLGIVVLQVTKIQDTCHGATLELPDPATEIAPALPAHRTCMTTFVCIGRGRRAPVGGKWMAVRDTLFRWPVLRQIRGGDLHALGATARSPRSENLR